MQWLLWKDRRELLRVSSPQALGRKAATRANRRRHSSKQLRIQMRLISTTTNRETGWVVALSAYLPFSNPCVGFSFWFMVV